MKGLRPGEASLLSPNNPPPPPLNPRPLPATVSSFLHSLSWKIWKNAQKFNHDGSPLWIAAEHFKQQLDRLYKVRTTLFLAHTCGQGWWVWPGYVEEDALLCLWRGEGGCCCNGAYAGDVDPLKSRPYKARPGRSEGPPCLFSPMRVAWYKGGIPALLCRSHHRYVWGGSSPDTQGGDAFGRSAQLLL